MEKNRDDLLILVDENDCEIGYGEKMEVHKHAKLHRAFSLFIFNRKDYTMLLHKRADGKYHSGGLWTNACCSHPRKGEELREAVIRRMKEELGLEFEELDSQPSEDGYKYGGLSELGSFQYFQQYDDCAEHEIDHVFYLSVMKPEITLSPDPDEISEVKWIRMEELVGWMKERPEDFTAWFPKAFALAYERMREETE